MAPLYFLFQNSDDFGGRNKPKQNNALTQCIEDPACVEVSNTRAICKKILIFLPSLAHTLAFFDPDWCKVVFWTDFLSVSKVQVFAENLKMGHLGRFWLLHSASVVYFIKPQCAMTSSQPHIVTYLSTFYSTSHVLESAVETLLLMLWYLIKHLLVDVFVRWDPTVTR